MRVLIAFVTVLTTTGLILSAADQKDGATATAVELETNAKLPVPATAWASFRNGKAQRGIATCEFTKTPELLWEFPTEHGWVTSAAIVGEHVYAPSLTGYLYCLDRQTGKEIWKYRSIDSPDPKEFAPGFKAAPLVTETAIYLGDEDGVIHAVNRATGAKQWTFSTDAEIAGGAAMFENRLIVGSHDSFLYCLNPDGSLEWKFATEDRINCAAAIADDATFVTGCDNHLRVIDIRESKETLAMNLGSYLIASPAIVDNMLYVGTHGSEFLAIDWKEARVVWRYPGDHEFAYEASASVTEKYVLIGGCDKQMHCIDRHTGKGLWDFPYASPDYKFPGGGRTTASFSGRTMAIFMG